MRRTWLVSILALALVFAPIAAEAQQAPDSVAMSFQDADLVTVVEHVGRITGITFLFDPEQVTGKITLLAPGGVSSSVALELLKSALALRGYSLLSRTEGVWIVPAERGALEGSIIRVVPLTYAWAGELAHTLSRVASSRVRVVPHYPTNSLVLSGPQAEVDELIDIITPSARD